MARNTKGRHKRGSSWLIKRQLCNHKREVLAKQAQKEGAANIRRKIAAKEQNLGDVEAPILYSSEVFHKLIQEYNDKELGINSKDGNNPVLILQQLKHKPPYAGCIRQIAIDKYHVQYIMAEQIFV